MKILYLVNIKKFPELFVSIAICQSAGIVGSAFTISSVKTWYPTLTKPPFAPPNFIFSPVWITLYALMGISLFLIWQSESPKRHLALTIFGIHLFFNILWSVIFFGLRQPFYAFVEILFLLFFIILVIYKFWQINKKASLILVPYLAWVSFAAALNFAIWRLNP